MNSIDNKDWLQLCMNRSSICLSELKGYEEIVTILIKKLVEYEQRFNLLENRVNALKEVLND